MASLSPTEELFLNTEEEEAVNIDGCGFKTKPKPKSNICYHLKYPNSCPTIHYNPQPTSNCFESQAPVKNKPTLGKSKCFLEKGDLRHSELPHCVYSTHSWTVLFKCKFKCKFKVKIVGQAWGTALDHWGRVQSWALPKMKNKRKNKILSIWGPEW